MFLFEKGSGRLIEKSLRAILFNPRAKTSVVSIRLKNPEKVRFFSFPLFFVARFTRACRLGVRLVEEFVDTFFPAGFKGEN